MSPAGYTADVAEERGQWYGYITCPGSTRQRHMQSVPDAAAPEAVNCAGPCGSLETAQGATERLIEAMASQAAALDEARELLAADPGRRDEDLYQLLRGCGYDHEESWAAVAFAQARVDFDTSSLG